MFQQNLSTGRRLAGPVRPVRHHPAHHPLRAPRRPAPAGLGRRPHLARRVPGRRDRPLRHAGRAGAARGHRGRGVRLLPDPVDRHQRDLGLQPDRGVRALRRAAAVLREGQPRPADPGDHHRLLLRRPARGAGRLRHPGGHHRRDAHGARLPAHQGRGGRPDRQHRPGRLRRPGHARSSPWPPSRPAPATTRGSTSRPSAPWSAARPRSSPSSSRWSWSSSSTAVAASARPGCPPWSAVSAFGFAQFVAANYISVPLADIVAALVAAARRRAAAAGLDAVRGAHRRPRRRRGGGAGARRGAASGRRQPHGVSTSVTSSTVARRRPVRRRRPGPATATPCTTPAARSSRPTRRTCVIIAIFSIVNIPAIKEYFAEEPFTFAFAWPGLDVLNTAGEPVATTTFGFNWLPAAGTLMILAGLITMLILKVSPGRGPAHLRPDLRRAQVRHHHRDGGAGAGLRDEPVGPDRARSVPGSPAPARRSRCSPRSWAGSAWR